MPINAAVIVAVIGLVLAIAVWVKTRRLGPVFGVLLAAFVVMAFTDQSILAQGGQMVGQAISWVFDTVLNF